nr:hypothetical protein [Tanacetum cinerariifolium]
MLTYLSKLEASEGFNQIIDFLNESNIKLQALVDKKKVMITEAAIREGVLVEQEIEGEGDADQYVEEVTAGDDAHRDDSAAHGEVPTISQEPSIPSPTPPTPQPQPPQDVPSTSQRVDTSDDTVMDDELNQGTMIAEMDDKDVVVIMDDKKVEEAKEDETEPAKVQEVVDVVTTVKLVTKVVTAASETVTAASATIPTAEPQVLAATLTAAPVRVIAAASRRRKGVVIRDLESESATSTIIPAETKSKDKGKGIMVEEPKPLKKKQQIDQDKQC